MKLGFHAGKFMAFLKPLIIDLGTSYKSATKYFCIIQGSNKYIQIGGLLASQNSHGTIFNDICSRTKAQNKRCMRQLVCI